MSYFQFKNIINTDPFADLYNRVRPTYDAFISIKNQVGIYEKMERIPGGPKNFMQTALKVVEETQKRIHEFESEVCASFHKIQMDKFLLVQVICGNILIITFL